MLRLDKFALSPAVAVLYAADTMQDIREQYPDNDSGTTANDRGWITTRVAAAALGVKPRQVRNYISEGILEATTEGEGVNRRYLVSIPSVETLRNERAAQGKLPGQGPEHNRDAADSAAEAGYTSPDTPELVRELTAELREAHYRLGRAEAQVELTAQTESTLREQLAREQERADLERERADRLEVELVEAHRIVSEPREFYETAAEAEVSPEQQPQKPSERRSWLVRFFFGP